MARTRAVVVSASPAPVETRYLGVMCWAARCPQQSLCGQRRQRWGQRPQVPASQPCFLMRVATLLRTDDARRDDPGPSWMRSGREGRRSRRAKSQSFLLAVAVAAVVDAVVAVNAERPPASHPCTLAPRCCCPVVPPRRRTNFLAVRE